ncbi:MAG: RnfH family protein [Proteobacteria bacterium]|nr:RnfH family protein [Pseudomonadota bacterium]
MIRALPERQDLVALDLEQGATVRMALEAAGIAAHHAVGVYGRRISLDACLADGDRVEIYRPLRVDPKESRRRSARRPAR